MDTDEKPWKLHIGCHRKTLTSRDGGIEGYDSLDECRKKVVERERFYRSIGYYVWYAYAVGPDGTKHTLHSGTPYNS